MLRVLALCTGNTCRSPMFAALLARELSDRGVAAEVRSAGTAAALGEPASQGALQAMRHHGLDLGAHRSTPFARVETGALDLVLAMTSRHAVAARAAGVEARQLEVIAAATGGVPDPFGGSDEDYLDCAGVLLQEARRVATGLLGRVVGQAREALDAANRLDPRSAADGRPDAIRYADGIDRWIPRLADEVVPALAIAARGQHLERWVIPRDTFPIDRPGYLRWRRAVQLRQGERARALLAGVVTEDLAGRVATLVAKSAAKGDRDGQALEDAACLLFLEEIAAFAAGHQDYEEERYLTILRRTWAKMSPRAHALALALPLQEPFKGLVAKALAG